MKIVDIYFNIFHPKDPLFIISEIIYHTQLINMEYPLLLLEYSFLSEQRYNFCKTNDRKFL